MAPDVVSKKVAKLQGKVALEIALIATRDDLDGENKY